MAHPMMPAPTTTTSASWTSDRRAALRSVSDWTSMGMGVSMGVFGLLSSGGGPEGRRHGAGAIAAHARLDEYPRVLLVPTLGRMTKGEVRRSNEPNVDKSRVATREKGMPRGRKGGFERSRWQKHPGRQTWELYVLRRKERTSRRSFGLRARPRARKVVENLLGNDRGFYRRSVVIGARKFGPQLRNRACKSCDCGNLLKTGANQKRSIRLLKGR